MASNGRLRPKQQAFVRALLTERDVRAAARACGIGERTAYRWLKQEAVQTALRDAERAVMEETLRGLLNLSRQALETLESAMQEATPAARVRAADIVLSRLLQLRQVLELEERVARLERLLEKRNGRVP